MNRRHERDVLLKREPLPRPVEDQLSALSGLEPPVDLLAEVVDRVEEIGRPRRLDWFSTGSRLAAAAVIALVALGVATLLPADGPSVGDPADGSPTPFPSLIQLEPPPLDSLPTAGTVERTLAPTEPGIPTAYGHGSLWLASDPPGTLVRMDPVTGEILATIEVSGPADRPYNMAPALDNRWVWASAGVDNAIVRIDPQTNQVVDRFEVDALGYQMISTGSDLYMTDFDRDVVVHLDAETGEIRDRIQLPGGPSGLAVTDEGLWVSLWREQRLLLMDPQTVQTLGEYEIALSSIALTPDGDSLWIAGNNSRPLERFSIAERRVVARTEEMALAILDGQPWGLTFRGEFVRLDRETLAWTAGRQIDMRGCDCTNLVAGPDRLYIGTRTDEVIVIAP
ncbi:MAG: hypothetical protein H0U86_05660 [Chloroflexi bacterium]|nr:hypothetical protein [Chloroflexota bacterium]